MVFKTRTRDHAKRHFFEGHVAKIRIAEIWNDDIVIKKGPWLQIMKKCGWIDRLSSSLRKPMKTCSYIYDTQFGMFQKNDTIVGRTQTR